MSSIHTFIQFLQSCITPVALISGVGLILLSLTNRLGRTIDRSRILVGELEKPAATKREIKISELKILHKRSRILRTSIAAISFSILSSSMIIPVLFVMSISTLNLKTIGVILFILSVFSLILSAAMLMADVILALKAVEKEVEEYIRK
ncbi:MAG: DUF2721 domain-containing protein [Bacteroidales bacterium]|nr:DUF2721 domain-containing protein [Bacteroidales bacterium]